jgi:hypothetical protein
MVYIDFFSYKLIFHLKHLVPSHPYESDNNIQYPNPPVNTPRGQFRDDVSVESNGTEYFELEVNTLNRCFDDIER